MADIRKRVGAKGTTYQVRYPCKTTKSGYTYKSFDTLKEARAFRENSGALQQRGITDSSISEIPVAVEKWLDICEKEGTDGNEPVTEYTLENYKYYAKFMKAYEWTNPIQDLTPPDIVEFRSWLIRNCPSRYVAYKTLTYFHRVLGEMMLRGIITSNPVSGINISSASRYKKPIVPPSQEDFNALLVAADRLANSKNACTAKAWERYRPMLYLAGDTGMRPGEYLGVPTFNISKTEVKVDRAVERSGKKISVTKTPAGWRWIDISPETSDMVAYYIKKHATENEYDLVFPTETGRWQSRENWRKLGFGVACFEAGLVKQVENRKGKLVDKPKYSPYDLRHFYASVLIESGVNLKRIQNLMGHTNVTTTLNIYGHLIERAEVRDEEKVGMIQRIR